MNQKVFSNFIYESSGKLSIYAKQNALFNHKTAIKHMRDGNSPHGMYSVYG